MLRTLKNAFVAPRLMGFKATSDSGACTVGISPDDVYSAASSSTGRSYLTLADVFARVPVVVGSPFSSDVGASGAVLIEADPTISLLSLLTHDGTNADDGSLNALCLGWDTDDTGYRGYNTDKSAPFTVKSSWNSPRIELFKITPHSTTYAINIGSHKATLTRNDTGDYTVTFKRPFSSDAVVAVGTVIAGTAAHFHVVSCSATAVRVLVGASGSGSDSNPFYLVVKGSDNPQYGARHRKAVKVSDRLPRIIGVHAAYSGGTPSLVVGTGDVTLTDTGTGELTVTFAKPFAREPIVLANKDTAGLVTADAAASTSSVLLNCFNNAGAAADPADIHALIIGYDDIDEWAV